eukprot:1160138-Pelagomonas_calceolata.AAC.3
MFKGGLQEDLSQGTSGRHACSFCMVPCVLLLCLPMLLPAAMPARGHFGGGKRLFKVKKYAGTGTSGRHDWSRTG